MKNITVIGAGTMGNGIAHSFAQSGYSVNLIDVSQSSLDNAISTITKNLDRQLSKERINEEDKLNTLSNISLNSGLSSMLVSLCQPPEFERVTPPDLDFHFIISGYN